MALTAKRYATVDAQLQQVREQLMLLSAELRKATTTTDKCSRGCLAAMKAADEVENLRYLLAVAEARRQVWEKQEHPTPFHNRGIETSALNSLAVTVKGSLPALKRLTGLLG